MAKVCNICNKEKENKDFYEGFVCKECVKARMRERYYANREIKLLKQKEYREKDPATIKERKKIDYQKHKEKRQETNKAYRKNNPEMYKKQGREYVRNRKKVDIEYRIRCHLRTRLYKAVVGILKAGSSVKDLGCTVEELKSHLSSKFAIGMSWENYGEWHIDHIRPLASFDLTDPEQFKQACHFTNLQPLWAKDNLAKSDKV